MRKGVFYFVFIAFCYMVNGQSGNYLNLNGIDDYVYVQDNNLIDVEPSEDFTIMLYVKAPSINHTYSLVRKKVNLNSVGYSIGLDGESGKLNVELTGQNGVTHELNDSIGITDSMWNHVSLVINRSDSVAKLYLNSVLVDSLKEEDIASVSFANSRFLYFGYGDWENSFFSGSFDQIQIWSKALTKTEIELFKDQNLTDSQSDLIAFYSFENANITHVFDGSINHLNANINNGALIQDESVNSFIRDIGYSGTKLPTGRSNDNERVLLFNIQIEGGQGDVAFNQLNIDLGNTKISDIKSVEVRCAGSSEIIISECLLDSVAPDTIINLTLNKALDTGNNFFWITYDLSDSAQEGNVIEAIPLQFEFSTDTIPVNSYSYDFSRTIFITHTTLFSGMNGEVDSYRIPAICTSNDGTLIAASDARNNDNSDLPGDIDIVVRRSLDNGKTWLPEQIIADFGVEGASDPCLVLDQNSGRVILMFASHSGFWDSSPSNRIRFNVCYSDDNGVTWEGPFNKSDQVYLNDWNAFWVASGSASQLQNGSLIAVAGVAENEDNIINNYIIRSDDSGETWETLETPCYLDGDEAKFIELSNGDWMVNVRNRPNRKVVKSTDQGVTWSEAQDDLVDPGCNGELLRYSSSNNGQMNRVLFSNINDDLIRQNLTLYLSYDEAQNWTYSKTIYEGYSAYSSLTVLNDGTIGMLYENGEFERYEISFLNISLNNLSIGNDSISIVTNRENISNFSYTDVLFPNPTNSYLKLKVNNLSDSYNYQIYTSTGEIVLDGFIKNIDEVIDLSEISSGYYFIKIKDKVFPFVKLD